MAVTYIVDLTTEEREQAHDIITKGKHAARKVMRAHILLLAADEVPDESISEALHVSLSTCTNCRTIHGGRQGVLTRVRSR